MLSDSFLRSSGVFTTVCGHSFHCVCFLQCTESKCPVCRYSTDPSELTGTSVECEVCSREAMLAGCSTRGSGRARGEEGAGGTEGAGTPREDNEIDDDDDDDDKEESSTSSSSGHVRFGGGGDGCLMCLVCGHCGCSDRPGAGGGGDVDASGNAVSCSEGVGHATQHYQQTGHAYGIDVSTQRAWDFAGGGYVDRLIMNSVDGKMVEGGASTFDGQRDHPDDRYSPSLSLFLSPPPPPLCLPSANT